MTWKSFLSFVKEHGLFLVIEVLLLVSVMSILICLTLVN